jgi:tetratricopeptide (TPR) repeat protein
VVRVNQNDLTVTLQNLLEAQRFAALNEVLEQRLSSAQNVAEAIVIVRAIELIAAESIWSAHTVLVVAYARGLMQSRDFRRLLEFAPRVLPNLIDEDAAIVRSRHAWALTKIDQHTQAISELQVAIPDLKDVHLGIAHRVLAYAQFQLGQPWTEALERAKASLQHRELGLVLLDEGYFLDKLGEGEAARRTWTKALTLFEQDPFYLSWVRFNLGISSLRDLLPDAERHFLEMLTITRSKHAAGMRGNANRGLATARCVRGEWSRAEAAYREAINLAVEPTEWRESCWGMAHTLRLANRHREALEWYEKAMRHDPGGVSWVQVDRAHTLLELEFPDEAQRALKLTGPLHGADAWRAAIIRAELARRAGNSEQVVKELEIVPVESLTAREEVERWPEVFALTGLVGRATPRALERISGTVVSVQALGILRVEVNGFRMPIKPTGRVGELLVLLLERGKSESIDGLIDALYPDGQAREMNQKRKSLWELVKKLRDALGWPQSVRALGRAYELDPSVTWHYDVLEVRAKGSISSRFLEGVYSPWAREVELELSTLTGLERPLN